MFSAALRLLSIKDLKDLSVFFVGDAIDMQVLKDLKRCFSRERSRGTGPRATGPEGVLLAMRRSGAGAPELQSLEHASDRGGQAPALRTNLANLGNRDNPAHLLLIVIILLNRDNLENLAPGTGIKKSFDNIMDLWYNSF